MTAWYRDPELVVFAAMWAVVLVAVVGKLFFKG